MGYSNYFSGLYESQPLYKLLVLRKWRKDYTGFLCIICYICMWTYNYFYNMSSKIISFKTVILRVNLWFHLRFSSVQFSCSVMSDSLRHHGPQHARPPCPSPAPRVHPNSCPLSWWCHPTISSSVVPFSSCSQSLPASGSFQMSQQCLLQGDKWGVLGS